MSNRNIKNWARKRPPTNILKLNEKQKLRKQIHFPIKIIYKMIQWKIFIYLFCRRFFVSFVLKTSFEFCCRKYLSYFIITNKIGHHVFINDILYVSIVLFYEFLMSLFLLLFCYLQVFFPRWLLKVNVFLWRVNQELTHKNNECGWFFLPRNSDERLFVPTTNYHYRINTICVLLLLPI